MFLQKRSDVQKENKAEGSKTKCVVISNESLKIPITHILNVSNCIEINIVLYGDICNKRCKNVYYLRKEQTVNLVKCLRNKEIQRMSRT